LAEIPVEATGDTGIDTRVGAAVVLLATFLGISSVKSGNIAQAMERKQADRNNSWAWYQARNLREAVYESTAAQLSVPQPNESDIVRRAREEKAAEFQARAKDQERKKEEQKAAAEEAQAEYDKLSAKDDQFDLCEAALTVALAMMGVTALIKKRWLFWVALVPAAIGVAMGVAGFCGADTSHPAVKWATDFLS
jgi:hypothetical protein